MRLMRTIRAIVSGIAFVSLFGGSVEAEWLTYPRGLVRADSTDTLVMVEVYTDWCASVSYTHLTLPTILLV